MEINLVAHSIAGIIGLSSLLFFAYRIFTQKQRVNVATWGMLFMLDAMGTTLVFLAGNEEPWLQLAWTIGSLTTFSVAIFRQSDWNWTITETRSLILCVSATVLWILSNQLKITSLFIHTRSAIQRHEMLLLPE